MELSGRPERRRTDEVLKFRKSQGIHGSLRPSHMGNFCGEVFRARLLKPSKYAGDQFFQDVFAIQYFRLTRRCIFGCDSVFDIIHRFANRSIETV